MCLARVSGARDAASTSARGNAVETRGKLDALMGLVLQHLQQRCAAGQLRPAWATMLHTFERSILDTYRSKFTQFLMFFLCEKVLLPWA
jgi:RNA polymerase I-specific transcription initiation factor RRN3